MSGRPMVSARRAQLFGLVFLLVLGMLGWLSVAIYDQTFSRTVPVTLQAGNAGNQLAVNGDVKARGVIVGQIKDISTTGSGAEVDLAIDPDQAGKLPRDVSARLVPKTVFGPRYVDLVIPDDPDSRTLSAGDVIGRDRSETTLETEKVFNELEDLLSAVQPQKIAASLGAVAHALEGRGDAMGETLTSLQVYLEEFLPEMPELQEAITRFADTMGGYQVAAEDVVDAVAELTTTSATLAERRQSVHELIDTVTGTAGTLDGFLRSHGQDVIDLSANSRPVLEMLASHAPEFPCLARAASKLKSDVDEALGAGSGEPGLHVTLTVKQPRDRGTGGAAATTCPTGGGRTSGSQVSPGLLAELLAVTGDAQPADVAAWGELLVAPLLDGAEVTLR
ncbi:MCE family protein [Haloechinothrix sp. LS1_15]|uniref:MCE family protein n=1 Tax=Haloechinothrix sp. LS1_15 TaxID=2652248 RepID=UPI0029457672|nr:MCE family protein [Haloechinothrix sp. LS1_15]MDV6014317.1 MCE family protein [Haloechinothrix sp. LS1_15]